MSFTKDDLNRIVAALEILGRDDANAISKAQLVDLNGSNVGEAVWDDEISEMVFEVAT